MRLGTWSSTRPSNPQWKPRLDARRKKRLKISLPLHLRPLDPRFAEHEDVAEVANFNSEGLYFTTSMIHYTPGMKLMVTFPYGEHAPVQRRFLGSVVRAEHCWIGCRGVAITFEGQGMDPGDPSA